MALTQVKTTGLADDAVTSAKIADDAVVTAAIADDAVTGANIADDTVAEANMANDAISLAELKAGTDGEIITWDASGNPVAVGPGTDGQVLTSTGAGSPPAFEDAAAGGATINNATENEIVTVASNTAQLDAEANLTFDGTALGVTGRILIGTSTEGYANADDLTVATAADTGITIRSGTSSEGIVAFSDGTSGADEYKGYLQYSHANNALNIGADGTTRFEVLSNGNVEISDGDLVIGTSGHGIDFSATSNHGDSIGTETLADYETGKWTATLGNDGTFSASDSNCTYIKIGHAVFFGGTVAVPSGLSWTGGTELSGIPFSHTTTSGWHTANFCVLKQSNWDNNDRGFPTMWVNTSDKIGFSDSTNGNQGGSFRINTSTGHYFYFGGWYMTDQD